VICDLCGDETHDTINLNVENGTNGHNGDTMYEDIDVCWDCLKKVDHRTHTRIRISEDKSVLESLVKRGIRG
jgi:ribosome-binding protein aMBF1 (putative translation factor)